VKLGVVVHIARGRDSSIEKTIDRILNLENPSSARVYLENASGQGYEKGVTMAELEELFSPLPKEFKLCIDTQHSFASGLCKWQTADEIEDFLQHIHEAIPNRLRLFHLNDSKVKFGSRVDRHEKVAQGYIWGGKGQGFESEESDALWYLLEYSRVNHIPMILENPSDKIVLDGLIDFYHSRYSEVS
jgi:deoxyribonuclease-4